MNILNDVVSSRLYHWKNSEAYLCQLCLRYKADEDKREKSDGPLPAQIYTRGSIVSRHILRLMITKDALRALRTLGIDDGRLASCGTACGSGRAFVPTVARRLCQIAFHVRLLSVLRTRFSLRTNKQHILHLLQKCFVLFSRRPGHCSTASGYHLSIMYILITIPSRPISRSNHS